MSVRRLVVEVDPSTLNVTAFCREHGISTWFFWDLRRRHQARGDAVLEPSSRAPGQVANRCPIGVEDAIVAKRKELADVGLDCGAATIAFHLRDLPGVPSEATIWRVLRRRGFIDGQPWKAPKRAARSFTAERANDCWQLDDTAWTLADGSEVKILNIVDDCTRVAVASVALESCTGAATIDAFAAAAAQWGWPARFLSDNAGAFRNVLADAMAPLGVTAGHSRPYHPQTNGKVERFHQTLKRFLIAQPAADTIGELQVQLDRFQRIYNHERPHRSLDRRVPAEVWASTPKTGPANRPLNAPTDLRQVTVDRNGMAAFGTRYRISLGAAHAGQRATVIVTGLACHVFIDGRLVRTLTLNPTRRDQTLYNRPGRPRLP
jgi:transposase InsO family protein